MKILLEFDLFYTIIEIPDRFTNLSELDNEFENWVINSSEHHSINSYGRSCAVFDDNTFIEWLNEYKLKEGEQVKILKQHIHQLAEDSINFDGKIYF